MKKSSFLRYIAVLVALTVAFAFSLTASADFGDYAGDADYGNYDSYDGGDSYGGDYEYGGNNYNRNDGGNVIIATSDSNDTPSSSWITGLIIVIILIVLIFGIPAIKGMLGKNKNGKKQIMPGALPTDRTTLNDINNYVSVDNGFSQTSFKEELSNMYIRFQNAWQNKNLDDVRPCLSGDFYAKVERQLEPYRKNKQTNKIERISVLGVELMGWKQESGNDIIIANLQTRIVDYVVDDTTGNVIKGSNTDEKFMLYEWTLMRTSGKTTGETDAKNAANCPNCGAPLNLNKSAKCEYCGSIIEADDFDWVLSDIKGLSQRTAN